MNIELRIVFDSTMGVSVHGPIQDRMLCYSLLETARDIIKDFNPEAQPTIIQAKAVVPAGVLPI